MIRNILIALTLLVCSILPANAQFFTKNNLTGAPLGNGYSFADGTLYMPNSASLQAIHLPFSHSIAATMPAGSYINAGQNLIRAGVTGSGVNTTGFGINLNPNNATDGAFKIYSWLEPATYAGVCDTSSPGRVCWRYPDGNRHDYCTVWTTTHGYFYVDGKLRDVTNNVGTFNMGAVPWIFGYLFTLTGPNYLNIQDFRVYNRALSAAECNDHARLHAQGKMANSGSLQQGLVVSLPFNNCTRSGVLVTCPDVSGNNNTSTNDKQPPVVSLLSPAAGPQPPGNINVTASCSDIGGCTKVCYLVDGYAWSACPTVAPYTFSMPAALLVDGPHTIAAVATNTAGFTATTTARSISTANGTVVSSYYFDPGSNGIDTNPCSLALPCKSFAKLQTTVLKGGDSVYFLHDSSFVLTAAYKLCGGGSGCTQNFYPSNLPVTFTTYGGGTCNPFTLTTTGCATITISGITNAFEFINPGNIVVNNLAIFGSGGGLNNFCNPGGAVGDSTGVGFYLHSNLIAADTTIQNVWVKDFACNILLNVTGSSPFTNYQIIDNVSSGTAAATPVQQGIRAGANSQGLIQGNLVFNMGGGASQGNCIEAFNYPSPAGISSPTLIQDNVCHDFGYLNTLCGGPIGIYATNTNNVVIQFNESYRGFPAGWPPNLPVGACDNDGFDIDQGSTNVLEQYNYAHDNPLEAGIAINIGVFAGGNPAWDHNIIRYNIVENNRVGFGGGVITFLPTYSFVYNNTVVSNYGTDGICWGYTTIDLVFANNLCIYTGDSTSESQYGLNYVDLSTPTTPTSANLVTKYYNNDYWATQPGVTPGWRHGPYCLSTTPGYPTCPQFNYATLLDYQNATIAEIGGVGLDYNSLNVDPKIAGTPGTAGTCWNGATTPPGAPQPCPNQSIYALQPGSPMDGTGLDLTKPPYNLDVGLRDYWGHPIPHNTGSGFNIGADGAHH